MRAVKVKVEVQAELQAQVQVLSDTGTSTGARTGACTDTGTGEDTGTGAGAGTGTSTDTDAESMTGLVTGCASCMKSMTGCHSSAFFLLGMTPPKFFPPCKVHHHGVGKNRGKESSGAHARTHTDTHGESVSQCAVTILQASSFFICLTGQNYRQFFDRGFGINRSWRAAAGQGVLDALKRVRHYRSAAELLIFRWA